MKDGTILHVGVAADADGKHVSADNGIHPHAGVFADLHVADDLGRLVNVARFVNPRSKPLVRTQHMPETQEGIMRGQWRATARAAGTETESTGRMDYSASSTNAACCSRVRMSFSQITLLGSRHSTPTWSACFVPGLPIQMTLYLARRLWRCRKTTWPSTFTPAGATRRAPMVEIS